MTLKRIYIILSILAVLSLSAHAQQQPKSKKTRLVEELEFVDKKLTLPKGCVAYTKYECDCRDLQMSWMYYPEDKLDGFVETSLQQLKQRGKAIQKYPINVQLLGQTVKGIKIVFQYQNQTVFQIWAYGKVKDKSVFFQYVTLDDPQTTEDLAFLAQEIMTIVPN